MTFVIDLTPEEETQLAHEAQREGVDLSQYARQRLGLSETERRTPTERPRAFVEMIQKWREEDATDDEEELLRRDAELEESKANMNANRAATGEEPLF